MAIAITLRTFQETLLLQAITNNHAKILVLLISKLNNSQQIKMEIESDQRLLSPGKSLDLGFWETAHLPLPQANINTYFSLRAK